MERGLISDAIPRLCVRMDDGSGAEYADALHYLRNRIPVTLAINFSTLRTEGQINPLPTPSTTLTRKQIKELIKLFASENVAFTLAQHSNTNYTGVTDAWTWAQLLAELNTDAIFSEFGIRPRVYIQPGDATPLAWVRAHRKQVIDALVECGIEAAFGIAAAPTGSSYPIKHVSPTGMVNSSIQLHNPTSQANGFQSAPACYRPGVLLDPYLFQDAGTLDLGTMKVICGVDNGAGAPLPDLRSGARGWMLGENNDGAGTAGDKTNDWEQIAQVKVLRSLGNNYSQMLATHGEARTDDQTVSSLSTGRGSAGNPQKLPGHFSIKHWANFLRRLEDSGHVRCVTVDEFAQYLFSDYEVGTDLISNLDCGVPYFDANERLDGIGDVTAARGMSHRYIGLSAFGDTGPLNASLPAPDALNHYVSPIDYQTVVGRGVVGFGGRAGGIKLCANSDASYSGLEFGQDEIPPGKYKLSFVISDYTVAGSTFQFRDIGALGVRWLFDSQTCGNADTNEGFPQFHVPFFDLDVQSLTPHASGKMPFEFFFDLPRDPQPIVSVAATADIGTLATATNILVSGAALSIANAATLGVVPGARVRVRSGDPLPNGVWITGTVVGLTAAGAASVEVRVFNESGANYAPGSQTYIAYIDQHFQAINPRLRTPIGQWIYSIRLRLLKAGATPATLSAFKLEKIGSN